MKRRKVRYIAILPTLVTLANAICGLLSIIEVLLGRHELAAYLILVAMIFDGLDGKIARATKSTSSFGTYLDSLCDVVSFGVAPAFLSFAFVNTDSLSLITKRIIEITCLFYMCCAIIRLARFNVEAAYKMGQHLTFEGLPSPGAAGLVASSVIAYFTLKDTEYGLIVLQLIPVFTFGLALLMVSRIRYPHIFNQFFHGFKPFSSFIEFTLIAMLVYVFKEVAFLVVFLGYCVAGPTIAIKNHIVRRKTLAEEALNDKGLY